MSATEEKNKSIVICERSRIGRCFLLSLFVKDSELFADVYDRLGTDIDWCAVKIIICKEEKEQYAVFRHEHEDNGCTECPLSQDKFTQFTSVISQKIEKTEKTNRNIKQLAYMEIHMNPSSMTKRIIEECKNDVDKLIVTDTPDKSREYGYISAHNADMMLVVMEKDIEANISHREWIDNFYFWTGYCQVAFIYRTGWPCDKNNSNVEDSKEKLQDKIIRGLSEKPEATEGLCCELSKFQVSEKDAVKFINEMIEACQYAEPEEKNYNKYDLDDFKEEKYNRVKSGDKNRILNSVDNARSHQLRIIFSVAQQYNEDNWPQEWQQEVIQYVYHILTTYVKQDIGIGLRVHHAESDSPITLYAIESMFAHELLEEVVRKQNTEKQKNDKYVEVMKRNGVENIVNVRVGMGSKNFKDAILKMELTEEWTMDEIKTYNRSGIIGYHYVMSLQKLGEYYIWKELSGIHKMTDKEIENYAKQQMGVFKCRDCQYCPDNSKETKHIY